MKIASKTPDANKACGHKARVVQKRSTLKEAKKQGRIAKRAAELDHLSTRHRHHKALQKPNAEFRGPRSCV
jgi:hypothetical protein